MEYVAVITSHHVVDSLRLEPSAGFSELVSYNSNAIEVRVILIDLIVGISPSISNGYSFQNYLGII